MLVSKDHVIECDEVLKSTFYTECGMDTWKTGNYLQISGHLWGSIADIFIACKDQGLFIRDLIGQCVAEIGVTSLYSTGTSSLLTHCGLVMSYGNRDVGQHWLR